MASAPPCGVTRNAYEVRWREGSKHSQRTFKVKRKAERFAVKVERELEEGNSTAPLVKSSNTFREAAEPCLAADRSRLKQKTLEGYEMTYRVHACPAFGFGRISTITCQDIEKWIADLRAKPVQEARRDRKVTCGSFLRVQKIFAHAVARAHLVQPQDGPEVTKPPSEQPQLLTLSQVTVLAERLDAFEPYGLIVWFAVWTGQRSGEPQRNQSRADYVLGPRRLDLHDAQNLQDPVVRFPYLVIRLLTS